MKGLTPQELELSEGRKRSNPVTRAAVAILRNIVITAGRVTRVRSMYRIWHTKTQERRLMRGRRGFFLRLFAF